MKKQTFTGLGIATLIACLIVWGIPSTLAKPHEELTFEPIEFKPPVPEKRMLSNGMTLYLIEDHELPLFNINGLIKTGNIYDLQIRWVYHQYSQPLCEPVARYRVNRTH